MDKKWNWQKDDWPNFSYDKQKMDILEKEYIKESGIAKWLTYFGKTIIDAQKNTIRKVDFIIEKAKFFDTHKQNMNIRQTKVIQRIFREGPQGFTGGFSAKNYRAIAKTTTATTSRDLRDLVEKGIFTKSGQLKSTRYKLHLGE